MGEEVDDTCSEKSDILIPNSALRNTQFVPQHQKNDSVMIDLTEEVQVKEPVARKECLISFDVEIKDARSKGSIQNSGDLVKQNDSSAVSCSKQGPGIKNEDARIPDSDDETQEEISYQISSVVQMLDSDVMDEKMEVCVKNQQRQVAMERKNGSQESCLTEEDDHNKATSSTSRRVTRACNGKSSKGKNVHVFIVKCKLISGYWRLCGCHTNCGSIL